MNLEHQVTSLELSKKLFDIGVKQESIFCYQEVKDSNPAIWPRSFNIDEFRKPCDDGRIAAFTTSELLSFLPIRITLKEDHPFNSFRFKMEKSFYAEQDDVSKEILNISDVYIVNYRCDSNEVAGEDAWLERTLTRNITDSNAANALAKMLIYLIENNIIKK